MIIRKIIRFIDIANKNGIKFFMPKFFIGYSIAGFASVFTLLIIQNVLINIFNLNFTVSQVFSSFCALFVSFTINNTYTFKNKRGSKKYTKLIQYLLTNIMTISLNVLIASLVFNIVDNWFIGSLSGIAVAVIFNFIIYRFKIWKLS
jgi:putative flippase GtrA